MAIPLDPTEPKDFDFIIGDWRVLHRRLKSRLTACDEWESFEGLTSTRKTLGGFGNVEDNQIFFPDGSYRAVAIRSYDMQAQTWSIWWLDGRSPSVLNVPVVGKFKDGVGIFLAEEEIGGRPIVVRFTWHNPAQGNPRWEQAFSPNGGATWETNWEMEFISLN